MTENIDRTSNQQLIEWIEDTLEGLEAVRQGRTVGWPAHIREGQKLLVALRVDETVSGGEVRSPCFTPQGDRQTDTTAGAVGITAVAPTIRPDETSDRIGWCGDASGSPFGPTEPPDDVEPDQPMLQGPGGKLIGHLPDQLLDVHAICDERDRLRLQLQRARILLEEAPLHRYGNEYLQWCEKRRLQNAGLNAATCEHPPEWRSHGKCGICLQDVTPLEPRETSDRLPDAVSGALTDACMILDVVKGEWAEAWSEWDQGVRDRITKLLIANHEARSNTTEPPATGLAAQIEAAKQRIARWPRDVRTALGLPVEPSLQRCPECGVECRGTPIPAIVHLTGCSQENGSPVTTENNDG